jgi:hypothetical protein
MRVAVASKSKHWETWGALRAAGIDIISTWPDWPHNRNGDDQPSDDAWRTHSAACIADAVAGDVLLLYCREDERQFGALLECGAALGAGRAVYVVSPHAWPFLRNNPRVRSFDTLADAIASIVAQQSGERQRLRAA